MGKRKVPDIVDVRWVQEHYSLKSSLQTKLRKKGLLPYLTIPGTRKVFYKREAIEKIFEEIW